MRKKKKGKQQQKEVFSYRTFPEDKEWKWKQMNGKRSVISQRCANCRVDSFNTAMFLFAAFSVGLGNLY